MMSSSLLDSSQIVVRSMIEESNLHEAAAGTILEHGRRGEHAAATHKDWAQSVVLHKLWATRFVFLSAGDLWRPEAHNLPARSFCGTTDWAESLWVSRKARDKDIDLDVTSGHAALRAGLPAPEPVL